MEIKFSKRYIVSVFVTIFGLISLVSGTSYAILKGSSTSSNVQVVKAGSVELKIEEKYDSLETGFSIMKDTDGLQQETVYEFTITNIGSVPAKYDLKLLNNAPSGQTALSDEYIRIGLEVNGEEMGPMGLSNIDNIIDSNTINNDEVIRYKMRVWLDKNKATGIQSNSTKKAYLSLKVDAKQGDYTPKKGYPSVVYRYGNNTVSLGDSIVRETKNAYCANHAQYGNSCDFGMSWDTEQECQDYVTNNMGGQATCQAGTITTGFDYTEDYTTLNKNVFLKHNISNEGTVESSEACYILNNNLYCLKGEKTDDKESGYVSQYYEENTNILKTSFGESNCFVNSDFVRCSASGLYAIANQHGIVHANGGSSYCEVNEGGMSYCHE